MKRIRTFLKSNQRWAIGVRVGIYFVGMIVMLLLPERPANYKILAGLILVMGGYFAFFRLKENKEYSGINFLRLRHEDDDREKMMSFSIAVLFLVGSLWYVIATGEFVGGTLTCSLLGAFLLFNGITYRKSVVLKKEDSKVIYIDDPEFSVDSQKSNKLVIYTNQIIAVQENDVQTSILRFLNLKEDEFGEIKKWFSETTVSV